MGQQERGIRHHRVLQKAHHPWGILHEEHVLQNERKCFERRGVETPWQALVFHAVTKLNSTLNRLLNTNFIVNGTRSCEVRANREDMFLWLFFIVVDICVSSNLIFSVLMKYKCLFSRLIIRT